MTYGHWNELWKRLPDKPLCLSCGRPERDCEQRQVSKAIISSDSSRSPSSRTNRFSGCSGGNGRSSRMRGTTSPAETSPRATTSRVRRRSGAKVGIQADEVVSKPDALAPLAHRAKNREHPLARNLVMRKVPLSAEIAGSLGPQEQPSGGRPIQFGLREDPRYEIVRVRAVGERGHGRLVPQRSIALAADPRD